MNILKTTSISILILLTNTLYAADQVQVLDRGLDGDQRTFLVTCSDGSKGSVTQYYEFPAINIDRDEHARKLEKGIMILPKGNSEPTISKVCSENEAGTIKCLSSWDLDNAAKASCS